VVVGVARGLGGRLLKWVLSFGGNGKFAMLAGFFKDLPGVGNADVGGGPGAESVDVARTPLSVGRAGIDCILEDLGVGKLELVTARVRGLIAEGVAGGADSLEVGLDLAPLGIAGKGFLFFEIGSAGKGPSGGGRLGGGGRDEGRTGIVEVMVAVTELDIAMSAESSRGSDRSMVVLLTASQPCRDRAKERRRS